MKNYAFQNRVVFLSFDPLLPTKIETRKMTLPTAPWRPAAAASGCGRRAAGEEHD